MEHRDDAHRDLKAVARDHPSQDGVILARLTASAHQGAGDVTALLAQIRHRQEAVESLDLSEAALRELRDAGRP